MRAVIAEAVETVRPLIDERHQRLSVLLPDEQLWVDADAVRIAQTVGNLLNNAAKYTPESGSIWVSAERAGMELVIRVRDNGMGISGEILPQVFQLFTQADRSLDRAQGGLGIGLSLVKSLVEMHGGRVQACSEGLGKGSEFVIRLPLLIEPHRAEPKEPDASRNVPVARRVLIVDDNKDSTQSMALLLRDSDSLVLSSSRLRRARLRWSPSKSRSMSCSTSRISVRNCTSIETGNESYRFNPRNEPTKEKPSKRRKPGGHF